MVNVKFYAGDELHKEVILNDNSNIYVNVSSAKPAASIKDGVDTLQINFHDENNELDELNKLWDEVISQINPDIVDRVEVFANGKLQKSLNHTIKLIDFNTSFKSTGLNTHLTIYLNEE